MRDNDEVKSFCFGEVELSNALRVGFCAGGVGNREKERQTNKQRERQRQRKT